MRAVNTMVFITRCWTSIDRAVRCSGAWLLLVLLVLGLKAWAQAGPEISQLRAERVDDEVLLSAQLGFDLPAAVEDALGKGIPMHFVVEAELLRERWYWYDKKIARVERQMRLSYQPLTRRWRLHVAAGSARDAAPGTALGQSFDALADALAALKRLSRWKLADAAELEAGVRYKVGLQFRLDLSQLPRPFQIGALGQSDWDISASLQAPLVWEASR